MPIARASNADLSGQLNERRRDVQDDVQVRLRNGRATRATEVRDQLDDSDANSQGDVDLRLIQMRTRTVNEIDAALARLKAGAYGVCVECRRAIAKSRLAAVPFAVRCQPCQEKGEGRRR